MFNRTNRSCVVIIPFIMLIKIAATIMMFALVSACYTASDYLTAQNPKLKFEEPANYRVNPLNYPRYKVIGIREVPNPRSVLGTTMGEMRPIKDDDIWVVQYKVGKLYLIYSESYNLRNCLYWKRYFGSGNCTPPDYFHHIWITPDGNIAGGWLNIRNPSRVFFKGDKTAIMTPNRQFDIEWGPQPFFQRVEQ